MNSPGLRQRLSGRLDASARLAEALAYGWRGADSAPVVELVSRCLRAPVEARAACALATVQALPYRDDPPGVDEVQSADVTAVEGGDCEDLAALLVVLWEILGVRGRVVWLSQPGAVQDHVTAQAFVAGGWAWGEPTIEGARLGESPYQAAARLGVRRSDLARPTAGGVPPPRVSWWRVSVALAGVVALGGLLWRCGNADGMDTNR